MKCSIDRDGYRFNGFFSTVAEKCASAAVRDVPHANLSIVLKHERWAGSPA